MVRGLEKPPWWATVLIVVGMIALIVGLPLAQNRAAEPLSKAEIARMDAAASAADAVDKAAQPLTVAFLGDSYTGGSNMDSGPQARWPALVSAALNWTPAYFAVGGSGYLAPGQGQPFGDRVDELIASQPDLVVVAGGLNDASRYKAADIGAAAGVVFQRIRDGLPGVPIVVLGPFHPDPSPPATITAARDAIQAAASAVAGTLFVDPLPWFAAGAVEIGSDNTHPTDAGHRAIADAATAAFQKLGFDHAPPA